ncbi:MAG: hypothetical protein K0Q61_3946, partial [Rhodococcus erythropolis]|nr:hypothetical protein [Rhodococcus erythropolis]
MVGAHSGESRLAEATGFELQHPLEEGDVVLRHLG